MAREVQLLGGWSELTDENKDRRWGISVGNLTVTVAQLLFLAYMAGTVTTKLDGVTKQFSEHIFNSNSVNAAARLSLLEAQVASERTERVEMKRELLDELRRLRESLEKR